MTPSIHAAPQEPNMVANACLTNEQLQQLLTDAQSPESLADVSEHLEDCPRCRAVLEKLTLESLEFDANFLKEMKEDPAEPALAALLDKAKQGQPAAEDSSEQLIETEIRSFLRPTDAPGSMGRLDEYEIQGIVGRGGMGIVLRGFDPSLCRTVAIKLLAPHWSVNALARRRFIREARATAAVVHEHIVTIHAVREDAPLPYLVMQFVQGVTLHDKLQKTGPLELKEVLRIGMQAAQGLAVAHAQGLVHRDIKPANILLENGVERVKITDFGLARAVDDASVTHSGVIAGTPEYMSPEQARGEVVDVRSDLFSLGSVLYSLCTGKPPYTGSNALGVVRKVADEPAPHVRRANPEIPNWLAKIISKLMAKRPEDRYPSAAAIARVLEDHLAELQNPSIAEPSAVPERNRRPLQIAAALVLLLSLFGLTYAEATGRTEMLQYVASILRIQTPHGTLVLEIADPAIKVAINADGETITVTGAGPHELTLRPGEHQWQAIRDGKTVDGWVTIDKGEKQVLKVSMEGPEEVVAKEKNASEEIEAPADSPSSPSDSSDPYEQAVFTCREKGLEELREIEKSNQGHGPVEKVIYNPPEPPANVVSFQGASQPNWLLALSPKGDLGVSVQDNGVRFWNLQTRELVAEQPNDTELGYILSMGLSPDGSKYAVSYSFYNRDKQNRVDPKTVIYAIETHQPICTIPRASSPLVFSEDGAHLWMKENRELVCYDTTSGERISVLPVANGTVHLAMSSQGLLAIGVGRQVSLYDTKSRRVIAEEKFEGEISSLQFQLTGEQVLFVNVVFREPEKPGFGQEPSPVARVQVWRWPTSSKPERIEELPDGASHIEVSGNGDEFVCIKDGICTSHGKFKSKLLSVGKVGSVAVANDGTFALVGGGTYAIDNGKLGGGYPDILRIPSENLRLWRLDGKPAEPDTNESAKATVPKAGPAKPSTEKVIDPKPVDPYQVAATEAREKALKEARIAWHAQNSGRGFGTPPTEVVIHTPPKTPSNIEAFGEVEHPTAELLISNDGKYAISTHVGSEWKIWDVAAQAPTPWKAEVHTVTKMEKPIAFSLDSTKLMVKEFIWESASGRFVVTIPESQSAAFAPDGNSCWLRLDDKVVGWRLEEPPKEFASIPMPNESRSVLTVSAQNLLAVSSRNKILLYDINEKKFVGNFQHTAKVSQLVFAPDGKTLYFGATGPHSYQENPPADTNPEHEVGTWTMGEATPSRALPLPLSSIDSLSVSADGKWIAAAGGTECWVQRTEEGDSKQLYAVGSIRSIALSPDGSYALVGGGLYEQGNLRVRIPSENLRLWRLDGTEATSESKATETPESTPAPEAAATPAIAVEGNVPAPQLSGSINLDSDADVRALPNFPAACFAVATSPDGKRALAGGSFDRNYLHLLQMPEGKILRSLSGHDGTITGVRFATNPTFGSFASCSYDHTVQVWDDELDLVQRYKVDSMPVDVAFSPDGQILFVCCADGLLRAWDLKEDKELIRKEDRTEGGSIAISPSQGISAYKKTFDYFKFPGMTGRGARVMEDFLWSLALAPDGKNLYCGTGGEIDSPSIISTKNNVAGKILHVDLDMLGKEIVRRFEGHKDVVKSLSLSQDGRWLLSGSLDRTARLWDTLTGREVAKLPSKEWVLDVAIAPDASYALIASGASHQGTWRFDPAENLRLWRLDGKTQAEPVSQSQPRRSSGTELRELLRPIQEFLKPPENSAVRGP